MGYRRGNCKSGNSKKTVPHRVKFVKSGNNSSKLLASKNILRKARPHSTWENIVLHYLSKLRGFLAPSSCSSKCTLSTRTSTCFDEENLASNLRHVSGRKGKGILKSIAHHTNKYGNPILNKRESSTVCVSETSDDTVALPKSKQKKKKAFKIVSAAIDYGCAHGIIENRGKYFWLKNTFNRIANRSPTPCPRRQSCKSCKVLAQKFSNEKKSGYHKQSNVSSKKNSATFCAKKSEPEACYSQSSIYRKESNSGEINNLKGKQSKSRPCSMERSRLNKLSNKCNCTLCKNHDFY